MGLPRFYAPDLADGVDVADLREDESRHLSRVLRLGVGDHVQVFDGRGREWLAQIDRTGRGRVRVRTIEPLTPAREPAVALTLVQSVLKGDHMDEVVRDAVMLGVAAIQPVVSARTQVSLAALTRGAAVDRWRRVAIASAKQCGRAVLPAIHDPITVEASIARDPGVGTLRFLLVEPAAGAASVRAVPELGGSPPPPAGHLIIGPEGGWMPDEIRLARAGGVIPITLGERTVRADAMSTIAVAVLQFVWGDL